MGGVGTEAVPILFLGTYKLDFRYSASHLFYFTRDSSGRLHEKVDAGGTGAVSKEGDGGGIAAEMLNILLDPLEGGDLVHEPVVGHPRVLVRRCVRVQEP
jgi:hypothetical protein